MKLFKQVFAIDVISRVASSALCMRVMSTSSILTGMLLLAWTVMWVTVRKLCNVRESGAAKPEGYSMRIHGKLAPVFLALLAGFILCSVPARAQDAKASDSEVQQLRELVMKLQSRIDQLERNQGTDAQPAKETPPAHLSQPARLQPRKPRPSARKTAPCSISFAARRSMAHWTAITGTTSISRSAA